MTGKIRYVFNSIVSQSNTMPLWGIEIQIRVNSFHITLSAYDWSSLQTKANFSLVVFNFAWLLPHYEHHIIRIQKNCVLYITKVFIILLCSTEIHINTYMHAQGYIYTQAQTGLSVTKYLRFLTSKLHLKVIYMDIQARHVQKYIFKSTYGSICVY